MPEDFKTLPSNPNWEALLNLIAKNKAKQDIQQQSLQQRYNTAQQTGNYQMQPEVVQQLQNLVMGLGPARIKPNPNLPSTSEQIIDYLMRTTPQFGTIPGGSRTLADEAWKNLKNLRQNLPESKPFLDALQEWFAGPASDFRDALLNRTDFSSPTIVDAARKLDELMQATKNAPKTIMPLYRRSSLAEVPIIGKGEVFSNPFMSFSSNPEYRSGARMMLAPGASTLRLGGISDSFPGELEHVVGGQFQIEDILKNLYGNPMIRIKQLP